MVAIPRGSLIAGAIIVVAALDTFVAARGNSDELSKEEMSRAREAIEKIEKPGDILVHSPLFRMTELQSLGDVPSTPTIPKPEMFRSRRIILIDRTAHPIYLSQVVKETIALGELQLRVYEPDGSIDLPLYSLYNGITPSTMRVERNNTITSRCTATRAEGGYSCPGEPEWLYVAQRTLKIDNQDATCVWAHPTSSGAIVFEIPAQTPPPAGRRLVLEVSGGFNDDAVKTTSDGAAVRTEILQNGANKGSILVPNRVGFVSTRVNIAPNAPVELKTTTPHDGRRHYCLNAELLELAEDAK
jgi:hypothetical protein